MSDQKVDAILEYLDDRIADARKEEKAVLKSIQQYSAIPSDDKLWEILRNHGREINTLASVRNHIRHFWSRNNGV